MAVFTFGSIVFGPRMQGLTPMPSPEINYTVRHIPYSAVDVVDFGGRSVRRYTVPIRVLPAAVSTIEAALGTSATLTLFGTSYGTCTLTELRNRQTSLHEEFTFYDAVWLVP